MPIALPNAHIQRMTRCLAMPILRDVATLLIDIKAI